jgi:hypothetical protein
LGRPDVAPEIVMAPHFRECLNHRFPDRVFPLKPEMF